MNKVLQVLLSLVLSVLYGLAIGYFVWDILSLSLFKYIGLRVPFFAVYGLIVAFQFLKPKTIDKSKPFDPLTDISTTVTWFVASLIGWGIFHLVALFFV